MQPASADDPWSYRDTMMLAPMVRINQLPFRMLCAEHGADICYSEELVDRSLLACPRTVNAALGTIDYVRPDGQIVFRTRPRERIALQLGTACAAEALRAAQHVSADVRAIDVNMGCPVKFSLQGGMGSALLTQPERVRDILTTLVRNLSPTLPVTCKIRLLEDPHETLQLAKIIESCGVATLAVHARRKQDRPRHWAQWDQFRLLRETMPSSLPLVLNGDVLAPDDVARARQTTGADSMMLARGALWNPSIFRLGCGLPMVPQSEVVERYVELAATYGNVGNTKYTAMLMLEGAGKTAPFQLFQRAKTHADLRVAAAACAEHAHFTPAGGYVPSVLEPAPDLPHAPTLPINFWRAVPTHWKPRPTGAFRPGRKPLPKPQSTKRPEKNPVSSKRQRTLDEQEQLERGQKDVLQS